MFSAWRFSACGKGLAITSAAEAGIIQTLNAPLKQCSTLCTNCETAIAAICQRQPALRLIPFRHMPLQTIDDVVSALDAIIQRSWDEQSRLGYFAALYRRVTRAVRDGISKSQFSDGPLMEKLDVVFASRYLDALTAYQSHGKLSRCWKVAFDACTDDTRLILQHLLAGMNAHINLDLGVASAQVSPGNQLPHLKADFDQINVVLAAQVGAVEDEMSSVSALVQGVSFVGAESETKVINFNIDLARQTAWFTAEHMANEPARLHGITIDGLDLAVSLQGRAVLYPPCKPEALHALRVLEPQDVRSVIEILSEDPVPSPTPV